MTDSNLPNTSSDRSAPVAGAYPDSWRRDLSSGAYHTMKDVVSSSMLKSMLHSPHQYLSDLLHSKPVGDAADFGTVGHAILLEPHTLNEVVAIYPGCWDARDKDCKDFVLRNHGQRIIMTRQDFCRAQRACDQALEAPYRGRPFGRFLEESEKEVSLFYTDPTVGIRCRTRLDIYHPDISFDLKFTRHGTTSGFQRDALDRHYDLQAYMYCYARALFEGTSKNKPFVFVPVQSDGAHSVFFRPCSQDFLLNGQAKYQAALAHLAACSQTDAWPSVGGEVAMDLQPWQRFEGLSQRLAA